MYGEHAEQQLKQEEQQLKAWQNDLQIAAQLDEGIKAGETFNEYQARTGCPHFLRERYIQRQRQSGIAPHSVRKSEDPFLAGFKAE